MPNGRQPIAELIESLCDSVLRPMGADTGNAWQESIDPAPMAGLYANREASLQLLTASLQPLGAHSATLVADLTQRLRWRLQTANQFVSLEEQDLVRIEQSIRSWLDSLRLALMNAGDTPQCVAQLSPANQALDRTVASIYAHTAQARVISETYSVETQLAVLHLAVPALKEPVLDVGCGRDATLVKWLRSHGINTLGIDVLAPRTDGCIVADWFQFPWPPEQFGTVLAHLSFSLHFLHQHLRPDGDAEKYARQFMSILRSLKTGGRFVYAPGLPFIERHLHHDRFAVSRFSIENLPIDEDAATFLTRNLGENPMYACHIERA